MRWVSQQMAHTDGKQMTHKRQIKERHIDGRHIKGRCMKRRNINGASRRRERRVTDPDEMSLPRAAPEPCKRHIKGRQIKRWYINGRYVKGWCINGRHIKWRCINGRRRDRRVTDQDEMGLPRTAPERLFERSRNTHLAWLHTHTYIYIYIYIYIYK